MNSTLRIAWRNLGRSGRRTAITLAAIAIAQLAVLVITGVLNARNDWTIDAVTGPVMGHAQVHAPGYREELAPDLVIDDLAHRLEAVRAVPGVAHAYARVYEPALAAREVDGQAVVVVGVDPAAESENGGLLDGLATEGRPHDRAVLVGATLARDAGFAVGDEIAILGQRADGSIAADLFTVGGILSTPVDLVNRTGIVVALDTAQDTFGMPDMAHEITLRGEGSGDEAEALAARVAALPEMEGLEVLPWRQLAPELAAALASSGVVNLIVLLVVFVAAAAGVANTMLMATFERRRELGMMLSLGTTPLRLVVMILLEAMLLGLAGVVVGSVIGSGIVLYLGHTGMQIFAGAEEGASAAVYGVNFTGALYPYLTASDLVPGLIGVSLVSVIAALWPALVTARLEPMEAMRG